jgi:hypothetical protein
LLSRTAGTIYPEGSVSLQGLLSQIGEIYRWILKSKIAILMVASKTNNHEMAIDHFCTVPVDGSYTPHSSGKSLKKPH